MGILPRSLREGTAVHHELAARDVRRLVRSQVEHGRHDLRHRSHATERHPVEPLRDGLLVALERAVEHLRVDGAGMHRVAADLVLGVLARRHLGEDADGALARGVRRFLMQRLANARHRGDVHDGATAGLAQSWDRVLGAKEHAPGIHGHDLVPLGDRALFDGNTGNHDRGVVDQDVQAAVEADGRLDGTLPVVLAGDVEVHVRRFAAAVANDVLDLLALGIADVAEDDLGAFACERLGFRRALAPRSTADERDLPHELAHAILPCDLDWSTGAILRYCAASSVDNAGSSCETGRMLEEPTSLRIEDPGVRALFTEAARFQSWLDVEAALAEAQAELGIIPEGAAREIVRKAHLSFIDLAAVRAGLAKTGHPLVPLVWELDRACEGDAGGYVHWGATTQNVTQTGQLLQVRRAHEIFLGQLATLFVSLADLAEKTKDMLLPGRTHGQHAVPATFGFKVAVWIDELGRHVERLRGAERRVFVAMLGGGAGTLASLGDLGLRTQERMAAHLGMEPMPVPARTIGDHQAEYVMLLGMLAATGSKIGREIYTLMKQEFGEVEEPVPPGTVGSSTMPQKRNPKLSQDIIAAAAQIRALVPLALEAMQTEHEADRTTSIMMSRAIVGACELTGDMLQRLIALFEGLQVFPERMRENLDL